MAPTLVSPEVPVIFGAELEGGGFGRAGDDGIELGVDLFGSILFQLTRYEEIAQPASDEHDRYPAEATLAHRQGFLTRPLVDEYVEILRAALSRLWPSLPIARSEFGVRVSHDVDWPVQPAVSLPRAAKAIAGDLVRRRDAALAGRRRAHSCAATPPTTPTTRSTRSWRPASTGACAARSTSWPGQATRGSTGPTGSTSPGSPR